jgi:hypothetical protein
MVEGTKRKLRETSGKFKIHFDVVFKVTRKLRDLDGRHIVIWFVLHWLYGRYLSQRLFTGSKFGIPVLDIVPSVLLLVFGGMNCNGMVAVREVKILVGPVFTY